MAKNDNEKCVVYLSGEGYKISSIFGKILFDGRTFDNLNSAKSFCEDGGLDYFVA